MRVLTQALRGAVAAVALVVAGLVATAPPANAASLTEVTGFGPNPSGLRMFEYVPDSVAANPPVLVALHFCGGTGPVFFSGTEYAALADRFGFVVIYPSVTRPSACFDVSSPQALRRDGGSDPVGIVSMVRYEVSHRGADPGRVYVTGLSSGAMMTNVLLGDYPDVFQAGSAFAGVPFGCFATTNGSEWNTTCANGQSIRTAQQWGDLVRAADPGYGGPRPRMQLWHGTADTTLRYPNFGEEIKQWTDVHGLGQTPASTDHPRSSWTRTRYGGTGDMAPVEAISVEGGTHNILAAGMAAMAIHFFGLDGDDTGGDTGDDPGPPPPPPGGAGTCQVTDTTNAWNTGLTESITVTNTGTTVVDGWSLAFTLPDGQTITSGWNATFAPTSGAVTATDAGYNQLIPVGGSVNLGYEATHSGDTSAPGSFALNGTTCSAG